MKRSQTVILLTCILGLALASSRISKSLNKAFETADKLFNFRTVDEPTHTDDEGFEWYCTGEAETDTCCGLIDEVDIAGDGELAKFDVDGDGKPDTLNVCFNADGLYDCFNINDNPQDVDTIDITTCTAWADLEVTAADMMYQAEDPEEGKDPADVEEDMEGLFAEGDCVAADGGAVEDIESGFTCTSKTNSASLICADNKCCLTSEGDAIPDMCCSEALAGCCLTEEVDSEFTCFDETAVYTCASDEPESFDACKALPEEFLFTENPD